VLPLISFLSSSLSPWPAAAKDQSRWRSQGREQEVGERRGRI
jgi:hypothetical protein